MYISEDWTDKERLAVITAMAMRLQTKEHSPQMAVMAGLSIEAVAIKPADFLQEMRATIFSIAGWEDAGATQDAWVPSEL